MRYFTAILSLIVVVGLTGCGEGISSASHSAVEKTKAAGTYTVQKTKDASHYVATKTVAVSKAAFNGSEDGIHAAALKVAKWTDRQAATTPVPTEVASK